MSISRFATDSPDVGTPEKLTAEASSHRGRPPQKKATPPPHEHSGKTVHFGASSYVLHYDLGPTEELLRIVRQHGPAPLRKGGASAHVAHLAKYQDMLRKFPRGWLLHPDPRVPGRARQEKGPGQSCEHSGQLLSTKYVSAWVQRKHVCGQLRTRWPPGAEVDVKWLRSWCPDSNGRLGDYEDSLRLDVLEMKAGCPYHELSMWLCLVGPLMRMHPDVRQFLRDPQNFDECMRMIKEHQDKVGVPPHARWIGQINLAWPGAESNF